MDGWIDIDKLNGLGGLGGLEISHQKRMDRADKLNELGGLGGLLDWRYLTKSKAEDGVATQHCKDQAQ